MSKCTAEDTAVDRYLNSNKSSYVIAKYLRNNHKAMHKWVKQYEYNGVDAFIKRFTK